MSNDSEDIFGKLPSFGYFEESVKGRRQFHLISELTKDEFELASSATKFVEMFNRSLYIVSSVRNAHDRYWAVKERVVADVEKNIGSRDRWIDLSHALLDLGNSYYTFREHQLRTVTKTFGRKSTQLKEIRSLLENSLQELGVVEAIRHYSVHVDMIPVYGLVQMSTDGTTIEPPYILRDELLTAFNRIHPVLSVLKDRDEIIICDDEIESWIENFEGLVSAIYNIRAQSFIEHAEFLMELFSRSEIPGSAKISILHQGKSLGNGEFSVSYIDVFPQTVNAILSFR